MKDTVQEVSLKDVYLDRETQIRATVSEETIQRYYEVMADEEGRDKFPPILLFRDDEGNYWLADGHHRVMAAIRRKFTSIMAIIRPGTKADAIWEAAKANGRNGLPLSRKDLPRAVEMICAACSDRSNVLIAEVLGCDEKTVRKYRPGNSGSDKSEPEKRKGKDGKSYSTKRKKSKTTASSNSGYTEDGNKHSKSTTDSHTTASASTSPNMGNAKPEDSVEVKRRRAADVKEQEVIAATDTLAKRIDEWFAIAPDDMCDAFAKRNRERIGALIN